jgi:AcrR family transcriptional regulator
LTVARSARRLDEADGLSHNLAGQKLGRKGRVTRERILASATELLAGPRDVAISMSAVARQASLGLTALYNYFTDLTELLLALLEPVMESAEEVYLAPLRQRWPDSELGQRCSAWVFAYHAFWSRNARLLHLRNAMSDHPDRRMMMHRVNSTQPIIHLLVDQMGGDRNAPRSPEFAMATMLMIGIERAVTVATNEELPWLLAQDIQHDAAHFLHPGARLLELAIRDVRARNGTAD